MIILHISLNTLRQRKCIVFVLFVYNHLGSPHAKPRRLITSGICLAEDNSTADSRLRRRCSALVVERDKLHSPNEMKLVIA